MKVEAERAERNELTEVIRTERGWAGHFCAASNCRYRRNTLLELGEVKVIVSSVGCYVYDGSIQKIGHNRYYETMVFYAQPLAKNIDGYIEADVTREIHVESERGIYGEMECDLSRTVDMDMDKIHEGVVEEMIMKIKNGTITEPNSYYEDYN
jgi:hypothetical protein